MKVIAGLLFMAYALPVLANQPYRGPLLTRDIGKEGQNLGLISSCQLLGHNQNIKWDDVRKDIAQAIKEGQDKNNYEERVYIKFNAPSKLYVALQPVEAAGKPPVLKSVELFSDGGSYRMLKTDAARRLLKVITENCGALTKESDKRGLVAEDLEKREFQPNGTDFKN